MDMMIMLGFNETIGHLTIANRVCWHGNVLRRESGPVFKWALVFEVDS